MSSASRSGSCRRRCIADTVTAIRRVAPKTAPAKVNGEGGQLRHPVVLFGLHRVDAVLVRVRRHLQGGAVAGRESYRGGCRIERD
ncbi:hypothetical protein SCYAM73S_02537 [Streptomyces cyaneofuscatus]